MSLFDSQKLNQKHNLAVNPHDPFSKYDPDDNRFGEINSGTWYDKAYQTCVQSPEEDFLCPIVLASDKTTLSDMGDLHVDAIFMTTSIFNTKVSVASMMNSFISSLTNSLYRPETRLQHGVLLHTYQERRMTTQQLSIKQLSIGRLKQSECNNYTLQLYTV